MYLAGIALVSLLCSNRTNKLMILWTSDVHCNTDDLEYVKNLKKNYKEKGYKVILLDDGDFIYDDTISKEDETHGEKRRLDDRPSNPGGKGSVCIPWRTWL